MFNKITAARSPSLFRAACFLAAAVGLLRVGVALCFYVLCFVTWDFFSFGGCLFVLGSAYWREVNGARRAFAPEWKRLPQGTQGAENRKTTGTELLHFWGWNEALCHIFAAQDWKLARQ